ncbi:Down syndrome cell adhesion molecule homolog isoform X2 [Homalodisca vitripennis]|uniref:Down syndrome cell adhesion molecule homolog isoform X2 n=1 Tax=Homalodisca vitripennis TaxID=197043 RepID=UPI001EECF29C|nr:Down syndrome cell adhesion molecule homolog isoform X2 [Homalodisca vitripennis]
MVASYLYFLWRFVAVFVVIHHSSSVFGSPPPTGESSIVSIGETPTIARPPPRPISMSSGSRYAEPPRIVERPYFDDVSPRNITAVVGQSTTLNCRVKHLGDRTVSWMRKRDLHILTSNIFTYTGDGRFGVIHPEASDEWNLRIEYVQKRDAGIYECQVNTEPKINLAIMLNVEETNPGPLAPKQGPASSKQAAQANIWGPEDVYVKKGSTISLTCSVNIHSTPPGSVLWYQGASVVDFDSPRGGISLETEKTEAGTTSKLLVTKAALTDSGNYTCVPSNANAASVYVHVLNGEHPAAMQHGRGSHVISSTCWILLSLFVGSSLR